MCLKGARLITLENWVLCLSSELVQQNQWQHKLAAVTLECLVLTELWGQPGPASPQHPARRDVRAAVPCWRGCTQNPKLISHQFLPLHLRSHCRLHLAVLAQTTNGDFELKGFVVHFQSLNSIIPWCVLFNAQTACDMTEPEAFPSIMSSLHTLAALVSTQWQCTGRALSYANDPWIMGHGESSEPTFQPVPQCF